MTVALTNASDTGLYTRCKTQLWVEATRIRGGKHSFCNTAWEAHYSPLLGMSETASDSGKDNMHCVLIGCTFVPGLGFQTTSRSSEKQVTATLAICGVCVPKSLANLEKPAHEFGSALFGMALPATCIAICHRSLLSNQTLLRIVNGP